MRGDDIHLSGRIIYPYSINTKTLKKVSSKNDLGVFLDPKLNLNVHMDQKIAKAYGMLGFITPCSK